MQMVYKQISHFGPLRKQPYIYWSQLSRFPFLPRSETLPDIHINVKTGTIIVPNSKPMQFSKRIVTRVLMSRIFHAIRDIPRHLTPIDLSNPSKSNINARTNPRRRPNITINDPSRTRNPVDIHRQTRNLSPGHLIRRGSFPSQNPSSRRKPRASTHRNKTAQLGIYVSDV